MSFRSSSQTSVSHVLLTGKPGIGKSTLVKKVCTDLENKGINLKGFYTEEIRQSNGSQRIGFDVVTLTGNRGVLSRVASAGTMRKTCVGKYSVDVKSFEDLVMPIFHDTTTDDTIIVIDEIGKMEMLSEAFCREVKKCFNRSHTILATIPVGGNSFVKCLQSLPTAQTFELDYSNRNFLHDPVVEILLKSVNRV